MVTANMMGIHDLLQDGAVRVHIPGGSKTEVLNQLINLLEDHPEVTDFDGMRAGIMKRESMMSTGVGNGLALPHAKTASVKGMVAAFATTAEPVPYDAIDGMPVRMLFMMISTERAKSQHIKLLSRVSRLMNDAAFRERLLEAKRAEEILKIFQEGELSLT